MKPVLSLIQKAGGLAAPAAIACVLSAFPLTSQPAAAAISRFPTGLPMAQVSSTDQIKEPDANTPYILLLGGAIALVVSSGLLYLRSDP